MSRLNLKEMMNKVGILAFYINLGNLPPEEIDCFMREVISTIEPKNKLDESDALNHWNLLFIPVRNTESRIQVIRNDGLDDSGELSLTELQKQLIQFEIDRSEYRLNQQKDRLEQFKR